MRRIVVANHVAPCGHVMNASPPRTQQNQLWRIRQLTDSCINIILPSRFAVISFYFILLYCIGLSVGDIWSWNNGLGGNASLSRCTTNTPLFLLLHLPQLGALRLNIFIHH